MRLSIDTMAPVLVSSTNVKSPGPKPGRAPVIRSRVQTLNGSPDMRPDAHEPEPETRQPPRYPPRSPVSELDPRPNPPERAGFRRYSHSFSAIPLSNATTPFERASLGVSPILSGARRWCGSLMDCFQALVASRRSPVGQMLYPSISASSITNSRVGSAPRFIASIAINSNRSSSTPSASAKRLRSFR